MITSIKCNNSKCFFFTIDWQNCSMTCITTWGKFLMKTISTMNLHCCIDSKWNTIQTFLTSHTRKTLSMICFPCCTKNLSKMKLSKLNTIVLSTTYSISNGLRTNHTFFQGILNTKMRRIRIIDKFTYDITWFTIGFIFH